MNLSYVLGVALFGATAAACVVGHIGDGGSDGPADKASQQGSVVAVRVRRLTNAEFDNSVQALLGTTQSLGAAFAADVRQSGFTINASQRVDDILAGQIDDAAQKLADEAVAKNLSKLLPCDPASGEDACAQQFIATFGKRAYRRPLTDDEKSGLFTVYKSGHDGGAFSDGIRLVIVAVLESAGFLYVTELGNGQGANGTVLLNPYETASALSYFFLGAPPDDALLAAADANQLATPQEREAQARRLLADPRAKPQARRLVKEWLGIDALVLTSKDASVYPDFATLRPSMQAETDAFIDDVLFAEDGKLETLLSAGYSFVDAPLARFYGISASGSGMQKVKLDGAHRQGILTQASFLSAWGHEKESAPVKRGVLIRRKLFCQVLTQPKDPPKPIVPPAPDPSMTTRERFFQHSSDPFCKSCHGLIDPVGFAFEEFDGMGGYRTTENGKPIDSTGSLPQTDVDANVSDAVGLAGRLAMSDSVKACFARHFFRFASAQDDPEVEKRFVQFWQSQSADRKSRITELFVAYAASDMFVTRRIP